MTPSKISKFLFLTLLLLLFFSCENKRKLTFDEKYQLVINKQHVYQGENIFQGGNYIGRDSFERIIEEKIPIGLDFYVNDRGDIIKIDVINFTEEDSILIDKVNAYLRGECQENLQFGEMECGTDTLAKFDIRYGKANDGEMLELSRTKRTHVVFPPCRRMIYTATHLSQNKDTLSKSKIGITNLNENYELEYMDQRILEIEYLFTQEDRLQYKDYLQEENMNKPWLCRVQEGYVENEERFWMHPPRDNQFITFELVPFPEIRFPIFDGKRWTSSLSIGEGWGNWAGLSLYSEYEMSADKAKNSWIINGKGKLSNGDTTSIRINYHETKGIVGMEMSNHRGEWFLLGLEE